MEIERIILLVFAAAPGLFRDQSHPEGRLEGAEQRLIEDEGVEDLSGGLVG